MNDKIIIKQLHLETYIGLYAWEKEVKQSLWLDLELSTDIRAAAAGDDLHKTINYAEVCECVSELASNNRFNLIETLAENIATMILNKFNTDHVKICVKKLDNLTQVAHVGVIIERP